MKFCIYILDQNKINKYISQYLVAYSINIIGEVQLSIKIGGGGFEVWKNLKLLLGTKYRRFCRYGPNSSKGGSRKFQPESEIFGDFFN